MIVKTFGSLVQKVILVFIGYSADSCAYRIYNRRAKKIMETMNVSFDELSVMAFEQRISKPGLQSMTYGQISSGLDLTYAPSTITTQQPSEDELDLLFEAMYDDYIGGQPSATGKTVPPAQEPHVRQSVTTSTSIADTAPTPTNSSSLATNIPITSQEVDELNSNAMVDGNTFVNPFANSSTSAAASSSSQNMDPSNMHISKPMLQSMTYGQISSGLDLTYAPSTITTQQPTEGELDLLFEAMYEDYIGSQPSSASRTVLAAQAHQVCQTLTTSTSIADTAPTPTNPSSLATNFLNTSQDIDELTSQQQHAQQQGNQA
nr:hypothetical protein [Tanacetum cinerariifolium]